MLRETGEGRLWRKDNGKRIDGPNERMYGNCTDLYGDCTDLYGECTGLRGVCTGLRGDCTGLRGVCTGLRGDLDDCEISGEDRANRVEIRCLIVF